MQIKHHPLASNTVKQEQKGHHRQHRGGLWQGRNGDEWLVLDSRFSDVSCSRVIIVAKVIKIASLVMLSPLIWSWNIIMQHLFTYVVHEGRILKQYIPFCLWVKQRLWNTHLIASVMPQLQYVYFCIQILEAPSLAVLAWFCLHSLHLSLKAAAQGLQWKMAFCHLPEEGVTCTQLVCSKSETFTFPPKREKKLFPLSEGNIADILTRPQTLNCWWNLSRSFSSNFTSELRY